MKTFGTSVARSISFSLAFAIYKQNHVAVILLMYDHEWMYNLHIWKRSLIAAKAGYKHTNSFMPHLQTWFGFIFKFILALAVRLCLAYLTLRSFHSQNILFVFDYLNVMI